MGAFDFKFRRVALGALLVLTGGVLGLNCGRLPGAAAEPAVAVAAVGATAKESRLRQLLQERFEILSKLVSQAERRYQAGVPGLGLLQMREFKRAALDAELELCQSDRQRIAVLEKIVSLEKEAENAMLQRVKAEAASADELLLWKAERLKAEIALERVRARGRR
jgi:hypothetical protein